MKYFDGMKYMLAEDYTVQTPVTGEMVATKWYELGPNGKLTVKSGFGWDGASGPTVDTLSSMSASLVHDVFCLMMRNLEISYDLWQDTINQFFQSQCIAAGMPKWRASLWHLGVETGNAGNPAQGKDRPVLEAPDGFVKS